MSDFGWTEEQELARRMLRRWVTEKLEPATDALERCEVPPYELMRDLVRTFALADLARASFERAAARSAAPTEGESRGGVMGGGDAALQALLVIELCRVNPGFFMAFGASVGLAGGAIMARGTPEQRRRFGLPLVTMEQIGAWGMTEPGAGSDAFGAMRTVAREDGDGYLLSGQKTFITNAPFADLCVIYAKLARDGDQPEARPIHAFVVERGAPGFVQGPPMRKMGMHSSPTGELFLEEVRVPRDHLLGGEALVAARDGARDVFHGERTGMAPMALGIIERCLETALAYSQQRVTWGRPIAEYQLVQEKLARMFMHKQNVENLVWKQLALQRNRRSMSPAEASATKLYSARAATEVALDAVQLLGGNGYMQEFRVEQLARDAKLLQIGGGTDEIQIANIARWLCRD